MHSRPGSNLDQTSVAITDAGYGTGVLTVTIDTPASQRPRAGQMPVWPARGGALRARGWPVPTYTAPGVYVEEIPSTQKVLAVAPTAVAAFVGFTERAPRTTRTTRRASPPASSPAGHQFESLYGGFVEGAMLPLAVYGYFLNGG